MATASQMQGIHMDVEDLPMMMAEPRTRTPRARTPRVMTDPMIRCDICLPYRHDRNDGIKRSGAP